MNKKSILQNIFGVLIFVCLTASAAFAQSTAFTYQGKLTDNGTPANGSYEMRFRLFNQAENGFEFGTPKTIPNIVVTNGVFTVKIDVGDWTFDQNDRFMEIAVRPQGSANPFTVLAPLQQITLAPKAIFSDTAGLADHSATSGYAINSLRLNGLDANRYTQKNVNGEIVAPRFENLAADPAPASAANIGQVYFNTTTNSLMVSNGTAWVGVSSPRVQTFSGIASFANLACSNVNSLRTATFTKSLATSRLRITYKDHALGIGDTRFGLFVEVRIDDALVSSPTQIRVLYDSVLSNTWKVDNSFTVVGYADGIAAGTHSLTTTYRHNGSVGTIFTCFRTSEPYLIEIEEVP